MRKQREK
jgi:hypothetical protein